MIDIQGWFLRRAARQSEARARADAQQATRLVQQAVATPSPQATQQALTALASAVTKATEAASAAQRLVAHEQHRTQGKLPAGLSAGAALALHATQALTTQTGQSTQLVTADPTGQAAWAQLQRAGEVMAGLESALAQTASAVQDTIAAGTAYDEATHRNRALARERQLYLAQYGGVDPNVIMEQVRSGQYPSVPAGIMLHKDEIALCVLPAGLSEDKTTRQRVGGYAGYSIPIGYGVRFRVGSYQGRTITQERLTSVDQGTVIVTTQRVVFNGTRRTLSVSLNKVLNTVIYRDGVDVRTENRAKREVFRCGNPKLLNTYILIACQLA
jgi:hypothetical protein